MSYISTETLFEPEQFVNERKTCTMEKLPPEKVAELLRKRGMEVSDQQAAQILVFLRMLAGTIVSSYLEKGPIRKERPASDKAA